MNDNGGNPYISSGNFAVVFKMTDGKKDYAIKCFTREQEGREEALELIGFYDEVERKPTDKVFAGFKDKMTQAPLKNWIKAAGITKHITFHCARHTFGSLQVEAGTGIYTVQHILGHKNVETTQIYAAMNDETKRESVNRITLRAPEKPSPTSPTMPALTVMKPTGTDK